MPSSLPGLSGPLTYQVSQTTHSATDDLLSQPRSTAVYSSWDTWQDTLLKLQPEQRGCWAGQSTNKTRRHLMRQLWHGIEAHVVMLFACVGQRSSTLSPTGCLFGAFQVAWYRPWDNYRCSALFVERTARWPMCVRITVAVNSVCVSEQCTCETCVCARYHPTSECRNIVRSTNPQSISHIT